jgi:hypothetical protein
MHEGALAHDVEIVTRLFVHCVQVNHGLTSTFSDNVETLLIIYLSYLDSVVMR